jgi:hypothetical protein
MVVGAFFNFLLFLLYFFFFIEPHLAAHTQNKRKTHFLKTFVVFVFISFLFFHFKKIQ